MSVSYTGIVRKLLYTYKFQPYLSSLSSFLVDLFYEGLIQQETFYNSLSKESVFVPIPLHPSKLRQRGYDQVGLLSQGLSKRFGITSRPILQRVKKTHSQYGLSREARLENVKNAFSLKGSGAQPASETTIFLIDDVVTSGATFMSAASVLKKKGYGKVYGLALAHGQ